MEELELLVPYEPEVETAVLLWSLDPHGFIEVLEL
jgi:hypothetical protein